MNRKSHVPIRATLLLAAMSLAPSAKAETFNLAGLYTRIATFTVNPAQARPGIASCNFGDTVLDAGKEQLTVPAGTPIGYSLRYEVPEPMVWQDLETAELWLRAAEDGQRVTGVRFDEAANSLRLWDA